MNDLYIKGKDDKLLYEGDTVYFEVENPDMWIGGSEGVLVFKLCCTCQCNEWFINTEGNTYVSIGKGYDAYPRSLVKKETKPKNLNPYKH
tara:strand:+ start:764 stop:1033 length:270 start_codon:yes stop_codon:yes gene_type:complete